MSVVETATTLMNGCNKEFKDKKNNIVIFKFTCGELYCGGERRALCPSCKSIIKAKRECWQEELEFIEALNLGFIARYTITPTKRDRISEEYVEKRVKELKQALKITESVQ